MMETIAVVNALERAQSTQLLILGDGPKSEREAKHRHSIMYCQVLRYVVLKGKLAPF